MEHLLKLLLKWNGMENGTNYFLEIFQEASHDSSHDSAKNCMDTPCVTVQLKFRKVEQFLYFPFCSFLDVFIS